MPKVTINEQELDVEAGMTVLQACEQAGVEIPRFCYHERLSIAGNCRMCLVEVKPGPPKPQASCALPVMDNMDIKTDSPMVRKARHGVMEFLLINHPLDCPICDQGGECDLQDQAMSYGTGMSRFMEEKRAVTDKYMGPLINTIMTRCIHCTRCVRFSTEIAGVTDMGLLNRGENVEITSLEHAVNSELSGNVIDLCPVGALTSKPYQYVARPWELTKTETIDVLDGVGSNIRVDARGNAVLRVLPALHEDVNEEWISDKTRFACDALSVQRLDNVYIRDKHNQLRGASWGQAIQAISTAIKGVSGSEFAAISGNYTDIETLFTMKSLMNIIGSTNHESRVFGEQTGHHIGGFFNSSIAGIDEADAILLVGCNPRKEAAIVNARIRKAYVANNVPIAMVGYEHDTTYDYEYLGDNANVLKTLIKDTKGFGATFKKAQNPMIILGVDALKNSDAKAIYHACQALLAKTAAHKKNPSWNGMNYLHYNASGAGALALDFIADEKAKYSDFYSIKKAAKKGTVKIVWLLGVDDNITRDEFGDAIIIYQGHHGDVGASIADIILPGVAYTEKDGTYMNMEGRIQQTKRAVFPLGEAKEDWAIINEIIAAIKPKKAFSSKKHMIDALYDSYPFTADIDSLYKVTHSTIGKTGTITSSVNAWTDNFYQTCIISRLSPTMALCAQELNNNNMIEAAE